MLENSPDLFIRFDRSLKPVYVNPAVNRYLGGISSPPGTEHRIVGDHKVIFQKNVERVFSEKAVVRQELTLSTSDGGEVVGESLYWPEFDGQGNVIFAIVQFRDLTEQRRIKQRAALNERRLEALYHLTMMEKASEPEGLYFVLDSVLQLLDSKSVFFSWRARERLTAGTCSGPRSIIRSMTGNIFLMIICRTISSSS